MESVTTPFPLSPDPAFESTRPKSEQKWRKVTCGAMSRRNMSLLPNREMLLENQGSEHSNAPRAICLVSLES